MSSFSFVDALHRLLLFSNRCICYLRERHAALALRDTEVLHSCPDSVPKELEEKLFQRYLTAKLYLGLFDQVESELKQHQSTEPYLALLENEILRLKEESTEGRYDLRRFAHDEMDNQTPPMWKDVARFHAEYRREDLFERAHDSPGVYAVKNLEVGTLLIVEQAFASVEIGVRSEQHSHSINYWRNEDSTIEFCSTEALRLLNEVESQLLIGRGSSAAFDRIRSMQPIRRWLTEANADRSAPRAIPWRVLFETQQANPFQSKSHLGWFPLGSMFNHSCLPNCQWYCLGDYLFIYISSSTVRSGDPLTLSYCPLWIASVNERADQLRAFGIPSCQCTLCSYDRAFGDEYERQLKSFANLRALARQKSLPNAVRWKYVKELKAQYQVLMEQCADRPVAFPREFLEIETLSQRFLDKNEEKTIQQWATEQHRTFLERFAAACRFHIQDLPHIPHPQFLLGSHMQVDEDTWSVPPICFSLSLSSSY